MDIRNWPLNKIMQLPDECFGARWPITFVDQPSGAGIGYYISEMALPERCVIWGLFIHITSQGNISVLNQALDFNYKLSDQIPTAANLGAMESLFKGADYVVMRERILRPFSGVLHMRMPVASAGRRICLIVVNQTAEPLAFHTGIVISSVPTEIPEWLRLGPG